MSIFGADFLATQQAVVDRLFPIYKEIKSGQHFDELASALKSLGRQQDVIAVAYQLNRILPSDKHKYILAHELSNGTRKQKQTACKILMDIRNTGELGSKFRFDVFMALYKLSTASELESLFSMYGTEFEHSYEFQALKINIPNADLYQVFKQTPKCCNIDPICKSKSVQEHVIFYIKFASTMSAYRNFLPAIQIFEAIFRQGAHVHWQTAINICQPQSQQCLELPEIYDYMIRSYLSDNPLTGPEKYRICSGCDSSIVQFLQCSKCKLVAYCNSKCQLNHWKEHKKICGMPKRNRFVRIDDPKKCVTCLLEKSPLKCPCNKARYCNKDCQEKDWAKHRSICPHRRRCSACKKSNPRSQCPCKKAFYCNKDCQRNDWQNHQTACLFEH